MGPSVWLWEKVAKENDIHFEYQQMGLDSLLRALAAGNVDLGLSPLTITSERSERIDFSYPYYIAHSTILRKDVSTTRKTLEFLRSFFSINFFRALGALAFVIFIFGLLVWLFERHHNKEEFGKGLKGLWNGFWWSAVTMTTVGYGDKSPQTVGGKLVALVWMFTAIIIISGFTASIASSLTVKSIGSTFGNIQDFKEQTIGTIGESGTDEWLRNNFFTNKNTYTNMTALLQALDEDEIDGVAYDRPILQDILMTDSLAKYRLLELEFDPQFYAMGMSRNLPEDLKDRINLSILRNTEDMDWKVLLSEFGLD